MLQNMRDNSKGVISGILIGLLVIIFAVSGAEALFKWDAAEKKAIKVNGESITEMDIARGIQNRKQQIISRYGESVPPEYLTDEKLRQPVVDGLIQRSLLAQVARKGGLAANNSNITKEIASSPAFQKDGAFDADRFTQMLRYQGFTPTTYQKAVAEDVVIGQVQSGLLNTSFVTPTELNNVLALSFQTRDFTYLVLPKDKVAKSVVVADDEIKTFYDANPKMYTSPEVVAVDYIELSVDVLSKKIVVSDENVAKQFEQNVKSFTAKTERQASHILFEGADAKKRAEEVAAKLATGGDFVKLAKEFSSDAGSKDQGGDLGFSAGDVFPAAFEAALATLKEGQISAPVETDAGVHLIKLTAVRASKAPTFEESKVGIVEQLQRAEAETQFAIKLEKLKDLAFNAESLSEVAKDLDLTLANTGLFSKAGGSELTSNKVFSDAAFSSDVLEKGNASEVLELSSGKVVVLKKTDFKREELKSLEVVKAQVTAEVQTQKIETLLSKQAADVIASVATGKTLADSAASLGLQAKPVVAAARNAASDTSPEILQHAFSLAQPTGKAVLGNVKTAAGDYAVVALTAVHLASLDSIPEAQRSAIAVQLANIGGEFEFKSYQSFLEDNAKIKSK